MVDEKKKRVCLREKDLPREAKAQSKALMVKYKMVF